MTAPSQNYSDDEFSGDGSDCGSPSAARVHHKSNTGKNLKKTQISDGSNKVKEILKAAAAQVIREPETSESYYGEEEIIERAADALLLSAENITLRSTSTKKHSSSLF